MTAIALLVQKPFTCSAENKAEHWTNTVISIFYYDFLRKGIIEAFKYIEITFRENDLGWKAVSKGKLWLWKEI